MLEYIGNGSWFPGIPMRDIPEDQYEKYGGKEAILATGLYKETKTRKIKAKPGPSENKGE